MEELSSLPQGYRTIIVGDFNLDQRLQANCDLITLFAQEFNLVLYSKYSTHNEGGILDLILIMQNHKMMPSGFQAHFRIISFYFIIYRKIENTLSNIGYQLIHWYITDFVLL